MHQELLRRNIRYKYNYNCTIDCIITIKHIMLLYCQMCWRCNLTIPHYNLSSFYNYCNSNTIYCWWFSFCGYRMNATATEDEVAFYFRRYYRWYFINFTDSKYTTNSPHAMSRLYGQQHNAYLTGSVVTIQASAF
jgi:hypothetical protein